MVKVRVSRPLRVSRFRSMLSLIAIVMTCSLFLLVAGCGSAGAGTTVAPPTVTITASPTTVAAGGSSTLTVTATNATGVAVKGSDGSSNTVPATGGTVTVSPAATTTYTATATGAAGTTPATATATVTVAAPPPPVTPTVTLTASPTSINLGSSTTLTVAATDAATLLLQGTDGTTFSSPTNFPVTGGTETVSPTKNATYTVTATGAGGTATASAAVTVIQPPTPTVTIAANPQSIALGSSSTLTVVATNATSVTIKGTDGNTYPLPVAGGTQKVSPTTSTTYTVTADGAAGTTPVTASATVTVVPPGTLASVNHVIFMLQENHTFDNYFGMLNPYRSSKGWDKGTDGTPYSIDGIDDKWNTSYTAGPGAGVTRTISNNDTQGTAHTLFPFKSTCIDDETSAWAESFGDVSLGNYAVGRQMLDNGFVSNEVGFTNFKCGGTAPCTGFSDTTGDRAMGYYDQTFLNYYYYMASQFALSDRWFSPVASKSIPNRIATFTGGTTQGLVRDPGDEDKLTQLQIPTIFDALDKAPKGPVSWKIYYIAVNGQCDPTTCQPSGVNAMPATTFSSLGYSYNFVNSAKPCGGNLQPSTVVGDTTNSFCIDPTHIAPLNDPTYGYFADLKNGTLPSFAFIESGSGFSDEHPGYQQSVLTGQYEVATIMNALMSSSSWKDSVFFFGYDEGGGPYDHVPPVSTHTNDWTTNSAVASYPTDISTIAVNADAFKPCVPAAPGDLHCDLMAGDPGTTSTDDPAVNGFAAQLGFRIPNMVVSPFTKKHYVSHIPMDHTAIIKFVENRFIDNDPTGQGPTHLTARDAAQPKLLDFFDFTGVPWATPPTQTSTPPPAPVVQSAPPGAGSCNPVVFH
ncbi:MAG: phospholipase [Acidobacteriaceae bacterium]|nr:phospholipase [Acidobacteriaceae bacterium]